MSQPPLTFEEFKQKWPQLTKYYESSSTGYSSWQLAHSFCLFISLFALMYWTLSFSYLLTAALGLVVSGVWVRLFVIFHDCCHGSFFRSRRANALFGFCLGVLVFTPYAFWKRSHSIHHAQSGKLEGRGIGDVLTMTVQEYLDASKFQRFVYRVYRNPFVQFVVAPFFYFAFYHRFTLPYARSWKKERHQIWMTNLALLLIFSVLVYTIGWKTLLILFVPTFALTTSIGVWLFYVQHQYEDAYWARAQEWEYVKAALYGSSYFKMPRILHWFTGSIGFHHVHHLNPRIPNYRLRSCHEAYEFFKTVHTITWWTSFKTMFLYLWDEENKRMITMREFRQRVQTAPKKA